MPLLIVRDGDFSLLTLAAQAWTFHSELGVLESAYATLASIPVDYTSLLDTLMFGFCHRLCTGNQELFDDFYHSLGQTTQQIVTPVINQSGTAQ